MVKKITVQDVEAEVSRFWNVFSSKLPDLLEEFYAPDATVFSSNATRTEPGRLAVTRRRREYFTKQNVVRVVLGHVDVQVVNDVAAVASYTFKFHATQVASGMGKMQEEALEHGRATQVFVADAEGKLRILHEHLSSPFNQA